MTARLCRNPATHTSFRKTLNNIGFLKLSTDRRSLWESVTLSVGVCHAFRGSLSRFPWESVTLSVGVCHAFRGSLSRFPWESVTLLPKNPYKQRFFFFSLHPYIPYFPTREREWDREKEKNPPFPLLMGEGGFSDSDSESR